MLASLMAPIAAFVSAYAVSSARLASGKMCIASCRKATPSMCGMRWSARSKATLSLRSFSCFNSASAVSGESLPITRNSAPYLVRRSRSMARSTSGSSSTLNKIGFAMFGPSFDDSIMLDHSAFRNCRMSQIAFSRHGGSARTISD